MRYMYNIFLKGLYHEIEMNYKWYGWIEPYLEMNLRQVLYPFVASWIVTLYFTFFRGIAQRFPLCV
jgi:hypothetical protein